MNTARLQTVYKVVAISNLSISIFDSMQNDYYLKIKEFWDKRMLTTTTIFHKKKRIIYNDFSGVKLTEHKHQAMAAIEESEKLVAKHFHNSVLLVTNVAGSEFDIDLIKRLRQLVQHNTPYLKKSAVVGVKGLQKTVFQSIEFLSRRKIPVFDSMDDAKDWLVADEE